MKQKKRYLILLSILLILFIIAGLYNELTITNYTIRSNKINSEIKIVLLTDLHSCSYGESQNELIAAIKNQNPDIILMSGDIADDQMPDNKTAELLSGIAHLYPCYYVTGNHEFWSRRVEAQKDMFRSFGVTVLEGTGSPINLNGQPIFIGGVDDPDGGTKNFKTQLQTVGGLVNKEEYTILVSHRPELLTTYAQYDFDLVVSGHAHGGQWRLPIILPNGLLAPNQGFFPKYTTGIHSHNNTQMVISRGLSRESTRIPRFCNRPEIVVITLTPEH